MKVHGRCVYAAGGRNPTCSAAPNGGEHGRTAATLGGWNVGVSKYSEEEAISLAIFLAGPDVQKQRAMAASSQWTIVKLYEGPDLAAVQPTSLQLSSIQTR